MAGIIRTGLTAVGAIASLSFAVAPVTGAMSMDSMNATDLRVYQADLGPLNGSGAHGTAIVVAEGDQASVYIQSYGLSANLPHAQHIHLGTMPGTCPSPSADKDGDGFVSVLEAAPNYGPIKVSLTTSGDYSADSALAVSRFPITNANGVTTYERTFTLPDGITPASLANGEIVQHGISSLFNDKTMYDGSKPSELDASLPFEATVPADCGVFRDITPMVMMSNEYPVMFNDSLNGALTTLSSDLGSPAIANAFSSSYNVATEQFAADLSTATESYAMNSMTNPGAARDTYIDAFNHAKSTYFGSLEAARNTVVDSLSGVNDVAKDQFVNAYNQARDLYGNQLEMVKNQF